MHHLDWESMFRRYVFDSRKTPYTTPVAKLTKTQAGYELYFYCLIVTVLLGGVSLMSISPKLPHQGALGVTACALLLTASTIALGLTKHPLAAATTAIAPAAGLAYVMIYGFHPQAGDTDKAVLVVVLGLWLLYNWRIVAIANAYRDMPEEPPA